MTKINVLIYEDNNRLRQTLELLLESDATYNVIGSYAHCDDIEKHLLLNSESPDVILMDIDMPGIGGIEGVKRAKSTLPATQIIMFTVYEDEQRLFDCLTAGADGYILKKSSPAQILLAIKDVFAGGIPMTPEIARKVMHLFKGEKKTVKHNLTARELEILNMLSVGHSYKTIAATNDISIETVRTHLKNIYTKMHVTCGTEAVAKGLRLKIIQ